MFLWTAFIIGLVGSFHCAGMCGPIAIALPLHGKSWTSRVQGGIFYNLGRILTYMLLGLIFGLLGKGIHIAGFQSWASIVIGAVMVLIVLASQIFGARISLENIFGGYSRSVFSKFQRLFNIGTGISLFTIGLLNGILPCGLVYVGVASAMNTGEVIKAILFMALFGLGTVPVMLTVSVAGNFLSLSLRNAIGKIVPYVVILLGVLFILRGLTLGIPYISPKAEALTPVIEKAHKCCHK
jgi:uncharacterized protein